MDGPELSQLVEQRWTLLHELLQLSERQIDAIKGSRMTELMRILSEKQTPLNQLADLAERLRPATGDDPSERYWDSSAQRAKCRSQQEECEKMHLELLAIEAECESNLLASRDEIQKELQRVDSARQTINGYGSQHSRLESGGQLDLSSDA
ncbi:MAG: flagellar export chaperone FlgN [Planctomycetota bacterium]